MGTRILQGGSGGRMLQRSAPFRCPNSGYWALKTASQSHCGARSHAEPVIGWLNGTRHAVGICKVSRLRLDESAFRERYARPIAHDDVVEEPDIDEPKRLLDALGDELVRLTRLGHARGGIVCND